MHIREMFAITEPAELEAMLAEARLGCLVTYDPAEGLSATHLPFLYDAAAGRFSGHIARDNRQWRTAGDGPGMIVFQSLDAYVSPNWYASKQEHGRVVPTWNYEAMHVHGRLTWRSGEEWLLPHLAALTDRFEAISPKPWKVTDAPDDFIRRLAAQIIGVEVSVERVEAMRKLSQNRQPPDRLGVITGLAASPSKTDQAMAERIRRSAET